MSQPYMQAALNVLKYHIQQSHVLLIVTGVYFSRIMSTVLKQQFQYYIYT